MRNTLKMVAYYLNLKAGAVTEKNAANLIKKHSLTYPQVFFGFTPYFRKALYAHMEMLKDKDSGPTYYFKVKQAEALLALYQNNPFAYAARYQTYRTRFKDDGVPPNRQWAFYSPEEFHGLQYANLQSILDNTAGRLKPLPKPWTAFGFTVRLRGSAPIGEKDLANQRDYIQAESGTIGCLLYVVNELHLLQGKHFQPYEINSLVRTVGVQNRLLDDPRSKATSELPIHTIGKAFDFPVATMSITRRRDLLFILNDMDSQGMVSFAPEYQTIKKRRIMVSIHVVPHPQWEEYFRVMYEQATGTRLADASATR
jgi:hypothetical protein